MAVAFGVIVGALAGAVVGSAVAHELKPTQPVVVVATAHAKPTHAASSSSSSHTSCPPDHCVGIQSAVVYTHAYNHLNYVWLTPHVGRLVKAEFLEGDSGWIDYEQLHKSPKESFLHSWWTEHCRAVSHDPSDLLASHVRAFVNDDRFAIMRFTFEDGRVYRSDVDKAAFVQFFKWEEEYFANFQCNASKS